MQFVPNQCANRFLYCYRLIYRLADYRFCRYRKCLSLLAQRWIQGRTASPHSTVRNIFVFWNLAFLNQKQWFWRLGSSRRILVLIWSIPISKMTHFNWEMLYLKNENISNSGMGETVCPCIHRCYSSLTTHTYYRESSHGADCFNLVNRPKPYLVLC